MFEGELNAGNAQVALQQWEIITGFFLPLVVSAIVQSKWSQWAQSIAAFLVSLVVTTGQMWFRGELNDTDFSNYSVTVLTVFAMTVVFYKGMWKPVGLSPAIEERTNLKNA